MQESIVFLVRVHVVVKKVHVRYRISWWVSCYIIWTFILVFWEGEWLVGVTPSTWNFGSTGPRWSEIADFEPIIARSAWAVRPSEKRSTNTNRKSPTRFPTSLRWSSYVAPNSPKVGLKKAKRPFSFYNHNCPEESLLQSFFVWKLSAAMLYGIHWPNYPCKNYWWGTSPSTWSFGLKWPRWSEIADFRSIFARSASAITPSEKSSIITNRKSTTRFPMSPRWTLHRTLSLSPQMWLKNSKCLKFEQ